MQIEENKHYLTRDGEVVGPMLRNKMPGSTTYPWTDGHGACWTDEGYLVAGMENPLDLVSENPLIVEAEQTPERPRIEIRPGTFKPAPGYEPLASVLHDAHDNSARGKGNARHQRGDTPFIRQPIMEIGRMVGPGFNAGQAMKKAQEAIGMIARGESSRAEQELLGAIVYCASAILLIRERE